jgi:uncharacterized protein (TIGR03084 family)
VDEIVAALAAQHAELAALLDGLPAAGWAAPSRCEGWDVADVVLHLSQTDEMAMGSASGRFAEALESLTAGVGPAENVDDGAALMASKERGLAPGVLATRWRLGAEKLCDTLRACDPSARVDWVAGPLSARTLATTRLAETWIHTGDVADALQVSLTPTDRLEHIARLAWRTLPYAFARSGHTLHGPVRFDLRAPSGATWSFVPDEPAVTTIRGDGAELCLVAARRVAPAQTSLTGDGADAADVLELVRTYA